MVIKPWSESHELQLSKGHAAQVLYVTLAEKRFVDKEELNYLFYVYYYIKRQ
ncbi:hypothetical protein ABFP60_19945 [Clostridioides difficile]